MHFSLHTSPSTPSVTCLTITGSSQLQNGCGLELPKTIRQKYGVYTEIRRVLPYIRRINMYIRIYGIRIRRGEAGKYGVYTVPYNMYNYTNTVLANPTHTSFHTLQHSNMCRSAFCAPMVCWACQTLLILISHTATLKCVQERILCTGGVLGVPNLTHTHFTHHNTEMCAGAHSVHRWCAGRGHH
jgi:hypothetical protein